MELHNKNECTVGREGWEVAMRWVGPWGSGPRAGGGGEGTGGERTH